MRGTPFLSFFSFFPFFSSLFFFFGFFGRRRWRKDVGEERRCGIGENRRSSASRKKKEPRALETQPKTTQNDDVLGWSLIFFKIKTPQNDVILGFLFFFYVILGFLFLKKIKTPQNNVVLGFLIFLFFLKKDTFEMTSFWASSKQNDVVLCV